MQDFFTKNRKLVVPTIVIIVYLLLGLFTYFVVFKTKQVEVEEQEEVKVSDDMEIHPASVNLVIENASGTTTYKARLTDKDSIIELLEYHLENSGLSFTKTEYTFGTVITSVNGVIAPEGFEWRVFDEDKDVSHKIEDTYLDDERTYTLKLGLFVSE